MAESQSGAAKPVNLRLRSGVTNALKRALRSFGDRFHNCLYRGRPTTSRSNRGPIALQAHSDRHPRHQTQLPSRHRVAAQSADRMRRRQATADAGFALRLISIVNQGNRAGSSPSQWGPGFVVTGPRNGIDMTTTLDSPADAFTRHAARFAGEGRLEVRCSALGRCRSGTRRPTSGSRSRRCSSR